MGPMLSVILTMNPMIGPFLFSSSGGFQLMIKARGPCGVKSMFLGGALGAETFHDKCFIKVFSYLR